jgi:galactokinase
VVAIGAMTHTAFAPGRVELLGNHTDYNGGVVLSAALDLGITAEGTRRENSTIHLRSEGASTAVPAHAERLAPTGGWSDYPLGVASEFQRAGMRIGGFEASYSSTLPGGAGLSSSAAIEVATGILLMRLFDLRIGPMELAKLCRRAENEFVGVSCGLLDQASSVFGRVGCAVYLDCRSETVETVAFPEEAGLLIVNSGVKHALTGGEYNERRAMCFRAAEILGVPALRDATPGMLAKADMPDIVRRRAAHIVGENERVFAALDHLRGGNARAFGGLMNASHESSRLNFENSCPELDLLAELAVGRPGIHGARLTGGGFGGAIVAIGDAPALPEAGREITARYRAATGNVASALCCRPGDGAWVHAEL